MNKNPIMIIRRNQKFSLSVKTQIIKILKSEIPRAKQFHRIKSFLCSRQLRDIDRCLHWLYISLSTLDILINLKNSSK